MKKLFALLLAVVMVLGMVACSQPANPTDAPKDTTAAKPNDTTAGGDDTTAGQTSYFPLKEKKTLQITIQNSGLIAFDELEKGLKNNVLWQEILEKTNVEVKFAGWGIETISAMFANDEMGDIVLCGGSGQDNLFNGLAAEGVLAALNDYVDDPEVMPNVHANMWKELPEARGTFTAADGNLYCMGSYTLDIVGQVEGYIWVNGAWLEKAGLDAPTDLESFEEVLDYFANNDMNENGKDDEIALWFAQNANNGIESFLGLYGLPTKDGTWENYVTLVDGTDEAVFIPQLDEWKDFLKLFAKWYQAGYMNPGTFTDDWDSSYTYYHKNYTDVCRVGVCYTTASNILNYVGGDKFVCIAPFKLGEADVRWYLHPGYMGSKSAWCVPAASENQELACRFMDLFYDQDTCIRAIYGEADSPWRTTFEDGTFYAMTVDNDLADKLKGTKDSALKTQFLNLPTAKGEYFYSKLQYTSAEQEALKLFDMYEPHLNKTVWPRPYTKAEDQTRLNELRTDIFNLVNEKRAEWITGRANIDDEWDQFQEDLLDAGIEEFVEIMQGAYDIWYENYSKFAGK